MEAEAVLRATAAATYTNGRTKLFITEVDCLDFKKGLLIQCLGGNRLRSMFPLELISR